MAGSTQKKVHEIFQSMEYGPAASPSYATAQAWLDHHSRSLGLFVNGQFVCPAERTTCSLTDSKGVPVTSTVCAVDEDISQCASSATGGFKAWSGLTCQQRAKVLLRLVGVIGQHCQCWAELCELCGASCSTSTLVRLLQYYSTWAQLRDVLIANWKPQGVVAVAMSNDCSLYSLLLKVIPALAMGNSVIVVPSRTCGPPVLLLAQLFAGAGLPAGVLNVLTGSDMSLAAKVACNPDIGYVTYGGNKAEGAELCKATAGLGVPVSVSACVGATCPFIVFESADIDSAVDAAIAAAFKKNREVNWVMFVQESVHDNVLVRLENRIEGMKCVPLPSEQDRASLEAAVLEAEQQGATLIESCPAPRSGALFPPTVLCKVAPSSPFVVNPPPGPVLPLMTFRTNTEAVTIANHTPHGHAASIWTEDLTLALETAKSLLVGSVWVNSHSVFDPCMPASSHKDSGNCTDGGQEGLYQFLRPPSSPSPPPRRSFAASLDYSKFGTAASPAIIPNDPDSACAPKSFPQFVGGKPGKSVSGCSMAVQAPGGGSVLAYCPDSGRKDVRNAVEAAVKVQPGWMKKTPSARAQSLYSLAKGLEAKMRDMAASISSQTGVSMDEATKETELSVGRLTDWAAYCDKIKGENLPMPRSGSGFSLPEAMGVVGVVLPDSEPLLSLVTVLGAAIATGNAVIMVPSQKCPLPALTFIQVLQSSDLPAGLVSVITGSKDQMTLSLATHSVIKAIWYWGSAEGCQYLQHTCTSPMKTLFLCRQRDEEGAGEGKDWTHPGILEEMWRNAVQWKTVWIPTA